MIVIIIMLFYFHLFFILFFGWIPSHAGLADILLFIILIAPLGKKLFLQLKGPSFCISFWMLYGFLSKFVFLGVSTV